MKNLKPKALGRANAKLGNLLKYACFFVLFLIFSRINGYYAPFSAGLFAALFFGGQSLPVISVLYVAASLIFSKFDFNFTASVLILPAVFFAAYTVFKLFKKKIGLRAVLISVGLSRVFLFFTAAKNGGGTGYLYAALSLVFSVSAAYAACVLASAVFIRRVRVISDLTTDEKTAAPIFLAAMFLGLYAAGFRIGGSDYYSRPFFMAASVFFILTALRADGAKGAFIAASIAGIGAAFHSADFSPLSFSVSAAAAALLLYPLSFYASAAAAACVYFILYAAGLYGTLDPLNAAAVIFGAVTAILTRKRAVEYISAFLKKNSSEVSERSLVNNGRLIMSRKLSGLSGVFSEMSELLKKSAERPAARVFPEEYAARLLIAAQFSGVSELFFKLAAECSGGMSFDGALETRVKEALAREGITCKDAAIYSDGETLRVLIIVREDDLAHHALSKTVSAAIGKNLTAAAADLPIEGYAALEYKPANKYDVLYGEAHMAQNGISGDVKCAFKVGGDKFIAVLSDGMGHGIKAGAASENAVTLIEDFYRAGMDGEAVLSFVNHVVTRVNGEIFAAVDLCVADLRRGEAEFIKMGAADSYIRRKESSNTGDLPPQKERRYNIDTVEGTALPLGVSEHARPSIIRRGLKKDDFIIMASDGVDDALAGNLKNLLASFETKNPQTLADEILSLAAENGARDDMSVVVLRLFEKI